MRASALGTPIRSLGAEHGGDVARSLRLGAALGPMPTQQAQFVRSRKEDNLNRKQLRLEQCAWANRRVMMPSELRLWSALSARKLGVQFRREVPRLGRYIVDFCALSVRLLVEVDGECRNVTVLASPGATQIIAWSTSCVL